MASWICGSLCAQQHGICKASMRFICGPSLEEMSANVSTKTWSDGRRVLKTATSSAYTKSYMGLLWETMLFVMPLFLICTSRSSNTPVAYPVLGADCWYQSYPFFFVFSKEWPDVLATSSCNFQKMKRGKALLSFAKASA